MTVNTPFPDRLATPYWDDRGVFAGGRWGSGLPEDLGVKGLGDASQVVGDVTGNLTDVFRTIYSNQPGMYTQVMADGSTVTYRQPTGSTVSLLPNTGALQGMVGAGGSGMLILLAIGAAAIFFMSRGK